MSRRIPIEEEIIVSRFWKNRAHDAARAYDAAAYQAWGTFAFLNFPGDAAEAFQQRAAE